MVMVVMMVIGAARMLVDMFVLVFVLVAVLMDVFVLVLMIVVAAGMQHVLMGFVTFMTFVRMAMVVALVSVNILGSICVI